MPNKRGRTLAKAMRPSSCSPISGLRRVDEVTSDTDSSAIAMDHSLFEKTAKHRYYRLWIWAIRCQTFLASNSEDSSIPGRSGSVKAACLPVALVPGNALPPAVRSHSDV